MEKKILTLSEASGIVGISEATLLKEVHYYGIPYYQSYHGSREIFFEREKIENYLLTKKI